MKPTPEQLLERFEAYLKRENITLTAPQEQITKVLVQQMSSDALSAFFKARMSGVSFAFNTFEKFAKSIT